MYRLPLAPFLQELTRVPLLADVECAARWSIPFRLESERLDDDEKVDRGPDEIGRGVQLGLQRSRTTSSPRWMWPTPSGTKPTASVGFC